MCTPASGGHSPYDVSPGTIVGEGWRTTGSAKRGDNAARACGRGWRCVKSASGREEDIIHRVDDGWEEASLAGRRHGQAHVDGAGGQCSLRGESLSSIATYMVTYLPTFLLTALCIIYVVRIKEGLGTKHAADAGTGRWMRQNIPLVLYCRYTLTETELL